LAFHFFATIFQGRGGEGRRYNLPAAPSLTKLTALDRPNKPHQCVPHVETLYFFPCSFSNSAIHSSAISFLVFSLTVLGGIKKHPVYEKLQSARFFIACWDKGTENVWGGAITENRTYFF